MVSIIFHAVGRFFLTIVFGVSPVKQVDDEQCIIVANHNTHLDTLVLLRLFPLRRLHKVKIVAAKDYFSKGCIGFLGRLFLNLILVDRGSGKVDEALQPLRQALQDGCSIIIFPEGTRGKPGVLARFKTGVGVLAMEFPEIPVYPVLLRGIEKTLPRGRFVPIPFNIGISCTSPEYGKDYLAEQGSGGRKKLVAALEEKVLGLSRL
ncbi:1-acyl-sn-glycerol-3-phosphate acyltransferase [Desulfopila sp. IMCC35006]|nr:1-acyl-sn-glycerol-3-phosphate acyltransferase [Desulfopila sp. IMCC35006]